MANKSVNGDVNVEFTESQSRQSLESGESVKTLFGKLRKWLTDLKAVAFSGSYNDLSDKPTIPTVNDGTLTIQQNGTTKATFTANQAGNATANLTDTTYTAGHTMTLDNTTFDIGKRWTAVSKGQTWSRLFLSTRIYVAIGSSGILSISATRTNTIVNATFLITSSSASGKSCQIIELASANYSSVRCRCVTSKNGIFYFEIYDTTANVTQNWNCIYIPLIPSTLTSYTGFTDGTTIPDGWVAENDFATTIGSASAAIKNITRSGTTFTATRQDGSTFTFTQRDDVQKTGDTMTGSLTIDDVNFYLKDETIDRDVVPDSSIESKARLYMVDKRGQALGSFYTMRESNGNERVILTCYNKTSSGTIVMNYIGLVAKRDGELTYSIASPANFRAAIGAAALADLSNYLPISGGTLTGDLTISQNGSSSVMAENTNAKTGIRMNAGNSHCEIQSYMEDEDDISHNWYMRLNEDSVSLSHKTGGVEDFDTIEYSSNGLTIGGIKSAANCKILVANKYQTSGGETVFEHDTFTDYINAITGDGAFMHYTLSDLGGQEINATIPLTLHKPSSGIRCISGCAMVSANGTFKMLTVNWPQHIADPLVEIKDITLT